MGAGCSDAPGLFFCLYHMERCPRRFIFAFGWLSLACWMPCNRLRWSLQTYMFFVPLPTRACLPYVSFVWFLVRILTLWVPFSSTNAHFSAKNRFSRKFVLMPKGVSCACRQNEFLFKPTATNTCFWAICSKMKCVLVLNAVQYAAKRSAFWC